MRRLFFALAICLSVLIANTARASDDEAAIRAAVEAYVQAFNRGDADAVAALWADNGQWISPSGDRISGREAIRSELVDYFSGGRARIEVSRPQVRLLAPTVAVEEGTARVHRPGEMPSDTTYMAIHVKGDDGWKLESVRETEIPSAPSNFDKLKELDWMVGSWVDQNEHGTVETTCQWTKNRNFLTRSFVVDVEGTLELEGTQIVGYDAANDRFRSWIFDSDGGFGEGIWTRDGDRWLVKSSQTLQDGSRASSINIITYVDASTFIWESTGREVDGELQPNVGPVTVIRKDDGVEPSVTR